MDEQQWPGEWMRGVLSLCVLRVVADGPTYGYAIAARLADVGLGPVKGGTLYPILTRLESFHPSLAGGSSHRPSARGLRHHHRQTGRCRGW